MWDILIKGGKVVDGSGNPWFKADIAIKNGQITDIGSLNSNSADVVIEATNMIVCPGFIDMHSHSDFALLINRYAESKVRQGVTTEVIGNCGNSAAPLNDELRKDIKRENPIIQEAGIMLNWAKMEEFFKILEKLGISINVVALVGHRNIRVLTMGYQNKPPTEEELEEMKRNAEEAMKAGAFGLSTGLIYPPSSYADTNEIIELAKVVAKYGGIYASHIRGEDGPRLINSVREAIEIGEKAGVSVEISHHKAHGKLAWGKVKTTLRMIEEARERGVDATCDVYPYTAASFGLSAILPPEVHEGGVDKILERLKDAEWRRKIREEMLNGMPNWPSPFISAGWDAIMISYSKKHPEYEGKMIKEICDSLNVDPFEFIFNLLIEEEASTEVVRFTMREGDVCTVLSHPLSMVGSDASIQATYGLLSKGKPHPRAYGTFPRVIKRYVNEFGILRLEEAIRKMTSLPANKLKIFDRGIIRTGMWADIVVFNPSIISDEATYAEPHRYPKGIEYVIVNGKIVVDHGEHMKALPGKVLRLTHEKHRR
ncbi:MAG: D-aminoacylase [Candidatus Bathyarchaeota archaeon]|jgi:N-acyl-D-amino-acid deacylase|nr:D-aminoacylase [Candidatus Bathyarchaeota archaeon]